MYVELGTMVFFKNTLTLLNIFYIYKHRKNKLAIALTPYCFKEANIQNLFWLDAAFHKNNL